MSSALSLLNKNSTHSLDTSSAFEFREDSDEALSWFVYLTSNVTTFMQDSVKIGILYNIIESLKSLTSVRYIDRP